MVGTANCVVCGEAFVLPRWPSQRRGTHGTCCSRACAGRRTAKVLPRDYPDIVRLSLSGMRCPEIALRYGVSSSLIVSLLRRLGVSMTRANVGSGNSMFGRTHSEETKARLRSAAIRQFASVEARERQSNLTTRHLALHGTAPVSSIERIVGEELVRVGIAAIPQCG